MKNDNDIYKDFQDSLKGLEGKLHVLETSVPVEKQMEYFHYSADVRKNSENESVEEQIDILNSPDSTPNEMKYAMTFLAVSGNVKAYRALESYHKDHKGDWISLSLLQAKITLESEFSDEKQVFISTGLGGEGYRLRFFAFFKSSGLRPFSDYQRKLIDKEIPFFIRRYQGILEEQVIEENYFTVLFLIALS
ncbi:MAG: hypothetical protein LBI65_01075, partial [Candidatus Symbiothrix sp.]|nr:hypothetical protein [Candidatus Symbiothrix sp.]